MQDFIFTIPEVLNHHSTVQIQKNTIEGTLLRETCSNEAHDAFECVGGHLVGWLGSRPQDRVDSMPHRFCAVQKTKRGII
jgi:hypothetical protein